MSEPSEVTPLPTPTVITHSVSDVLNYLLDRVHHLLDVVEGHSEEVNTEASAENPPVV